MNKRDAFLGELLRGGWGGIIAPDTVSELEKWIAKQKETACLVAVSFLFLFRDKDGPFKVTLLCLPDYKNGSITVNEMLIFEDVTNKLSRPSEFEVGFNYKLI